MTTLPPPESLGVLEACWRFCVLGVVQGLTEFLPISSTAHLKVVPVLLGWGDPGVAVTAVIQLGSIAAVIGFFREDLKQVMGASWQAWCSGQWTTPEARLGQAILWGTLPILVAGLGIKLFVPNFDESPLRSLTSIGVVSIVMGLLLGLAERWGSRRRVLSDVVVRDGWLVGVAQTLALIPGGLPIRQHPDGRPLRWLETLRGGPLFVSFGDPSDQPGRLGGAEGRVFGPSRRWRVAVAGRYRLLGPGLLVGDCLAAALFAEPQHLVVCGVPGLFWSGRDSVGGSQRRLIRLRRKLKTVMP